MILRTVGVRIEDVKNREKWRSRTKVADPKYLGGKRRRKRPK